MKKKTSTTPEHIHKYSRTEWGKKKTIIYRCRLTGCGHYLHEDMVQDRLSLCWRCLEPFIMTKDKMRRVKPKCDKCQSKGLDKVMRSIDSLLENL